MFLSFKFSKIEYQNSMWSQTSGPGCTLYSHECKLYNISLFISAWVHLYACVCVCVCVGSFMWLLVQCFMKDCIMSIGRGKMMVEFFSAAMVLRVWR